MERAVSTAPAMRRCACTRTEELSLSDFLSSRRSAFATWSVVFVFALFQAETTSWSAWKKRKEKEGGAMDRGGGKERRAREESEGEF